jgi:hypothetical protein
MIQGGGPFMPRLFLYDGDQRFYLPCGNFIGLFYELKHKLNRLNLIISKTMIVYTLEYTAKLFF